MESKKKSERQILRQTRDKEREKEKEIVERGVGRIGEKE